MERLILPLQKQLPNRDNIFKAPSQNGQPAELNDATKPLGFQPPVSNDAPSLMFGGNKLSEVSGKKVGNFILFFQLQSS